MTDQEIRQEIKNIARDALDAEISDDEDLRESGIDSLSLVALIAEIEERLHIRYGEDDLQPEELITLQDLVRITEKRL